MRVVCTAGHVDHGKSMLVRALTGTDPDRFAEEQQRGLTIDLGFAWTDLTPEDDDPRTVAFVDLPGHERFVGNMLAGAGPVELALFIVAADEGWMPQSREHLQILDLLGVRHGVVAVTKADVVDAETAGLAVELVREELEGTGLAEAPVLPVSAVSGAGLDELRAALRTLVDTAPVPLDRGRPRLWIDRAFSITGAGTVVTGTLGGGRLELEEPLAVLPSGREGRVRRLEQLGRVVERAEPGTRLAVNLAGLDREEAPRGAALGRPGAWVSTTHLDARVHALPGAELGSRGAWMLHAGSAVVPASLRPLEAPARGDDPTGAAVWCRVELARPLPLEAGDRFVLRESGRDATLGGGVVVDADPPPRARGRAARSERAGQLAARADALAAGDRARLAACHVAERGIAAPARVAAAVGATPAEVARAPVVAVGGALASPEAVQRWAQAAAEALRAHHAASPVETVAPKAVARDAVIAAGCPRPHADAVLAALHDREELVLEGAGARTPEHRADLGDEGTRAREQLLAALRAAPFAPPRLTDAAAEAGASAALVRELERRGEIARLTEEHAVAAETIDEAHRRLHALFRSEGPFTAARAKDELATTRKYAVPLLELLDARGATRRVGDRREVRPPAEPSADRGDRVDLDR